VAPRCDATHRHASLLSFSSFSFLRCLDNSID